MVDLDYLILYTKNGTPIYSHKFNDQFGISEDFLLSAFLTSLNQYSMTETNGDRPKLLQFEDQEIEIEYSDELKLSSIVVNSTVIIFYYGETEDFTIGIGINENDFGSINTLFSITQLMVEIEQFMQNYANVDWRDIEYSKLRKFEEELHSYVVHTFMESHTADDECYLGEKCPFKLAPVPEEPEEQSSTLFTWIKNKFRRTE